MNKFQLLLTKLAEEASEVSKEALKIQQFGLYSTCPYDSVSNIDKIHKELNDLTAVIEILNDEFNLGYIPDRRAIDDKKIKINLYAIKSNEIGLVTLG